jgi:N-acetylglucosamine-6-sulfatase
LRRFADQVGAARHVDKFARLPNRRLLDVGLKETLMGWTRRRFIAAAALTAAAPLVMGARRRRRRTVERPPAPEGSPNILFILTDDQAPHTVYQMPKTLAAFSGGLDLTKNAYVTVPFCGPARVSLLTGLYAHNHRAIDNVHAYERYRSGGHVARDLMSRLDARGYRVGFFGKLMNGYGKEGTWVHPACERGRGGRWVAFAGENHRVPYLVNFNGSVREESKNQNVLLGNYAESWMRAKVEAGEAFFAYVCLGDPHGPYRPTHPHAADGATYTSPAVEENTSEELADKSRWTLSRDRAGAEHHQRVYEGQLEELVDVDALVKRLVGVLGEAGVLENTLIAFATDNGHMLGEHGGLPGKGYPYQEAASTPLLIRGPGVPSGALGGPLVSHLDLTATFLEAAGADTSGLDGRSLMPLFTNPEGASWRERVLVENPLSGWYMLREGSYAYMELPTGEKELYNLSTDPYELENLAGTMPEVEAQLSANLMSLKGCAADSCKSAEGP